MKKILLITILLSVPIIFFAQSDSDKIKVPDIKNIELINDTGYINDELIFIVVEKMPEYQSGRAAMTNFIISNIQYPIEAYLNQIEGIVYITFVIEKTGKLSDIRVLRGIGYDCDKEALRVVKLMPDWIPGKQRGNEVRVQFNLPIKFAIDEKAKQQMNEAKKIYQKATKKFGKSNFEEALSLLNNAINLHPYYIEALILRGLVYKELNDIENACNDWDLAKELGNTEAENYLKLNCKM